MSGFNRHQPPMQPPPRPGRYCGGGFPRGGMDPGDAGSAPVGGFPGGGGNRAPPSAMSSFYDSPGAGASQSPLQPFNPLSQGSDHDRVPRGGAGGGRKLSITNWGAAPPLFNRSLGTSIASGLRQRTSQPSSQTDSQVTDMISSQLEDVTTQLCNVRDTCASAAEESKRDRNKMQGQLDELSSIVREMSERQNSLMALVVQEHKQRSAQPEEESAPPPREGGAGRGGSRHKRKHKEEAAAVTSPAAISSNPPPPRPAPRPARPARDAAAACIAGYGSSDSESDPDPMDNDDAREEEGRAGDKESLILPFSQLFESGARPMPLFEEEDPSAHAPEEPPPPPPPRESQEDILRQVAQHKESLRRAKRARGRKAAAAAREE